MPVLNETRHLVKASDFPPPTPGRLRLYSMRFCPFAERTILVLAHKNIPYEVVNINLRDKPDWFLKRNPLGLVPVLEQDDKIVYESQICNDYLEDIFPQNPLRSKDPYVRARQNIVTAGLGKFIGHSYKLAREPTPEAKEEMNTYLDTYENLLEKPFFSGDEVGLLDFHMWPWVERMLAYKEFTGYEISQERFPKLNAWIARMWEVPAVKATAIPGWALLEFAKSYKEGTPRYDEIEI
ncbi:pyrimidodiazepine synthase [Lingula anatina]|uniref:Glutathione S-transferase omega n=1 Tax=Lingula anatina TaxID=7574 RepID=A0A1S3HZQ0_LINAN|nr:pyrimidodiazepine synthase [Lingula anatina]|eukprot:XP_013391046.1 pyrimidodiazepine synthase [Lingula anatina]